MAAPYQIVVKGGQRYHFYPKGKDGKSAPRYVPVRPDAMTTGTGYAAGSSPAVAARPAGASGAPAAGAAATAAAPKITPFLMPDDLQALADFDFGSANSYADIDRGLSEMATQTNYDRTQTDKQAQKTTVDATDNAIARGLFQSSIKDATLYDIEGQRVRSQQLMTDRMTNAGMDADRRKGILAAAKSAFDERLRQQAVSNARAASANQAVPTPAPAPAAAPAAARAPVAAKPKAVPKPKAAAKPQWQQGVGHANW